MRRVIIGLLALAGVPASLAETLDAAPLRLLSGAWAYPAAFLRAHEGMALDAVACDKRPRIFRVEEAGETHASLWISAGPGHPGRRAAITRTLPAPDGWLVVISIDGETLTLRLEGEDALRLYFVAPEDMAAAGSLPLERCPSAPMM